MGKTLQELNTEYWYAWERRGRGWDIYPSPVQLEAPLDAYKPPSTQSKQVADDGRVPTLFGYINAGISSLFNKKIEPEETTTNIEGYSYPDNPIPFETESELCCYRVSLPKKQDVDAVDSEKLLHMLSFSSAQLSYEIIGVNDGICVQWTCRKEDSERLLSQLRSYFPNLAIQQTEGYNLPLHDKTHIAIADLGYENEFLLPLSTARKFSPDPLIGIIAALDNLSYGESGMVQILFQGAVEPWGIVMPFIASDGDKGAFFEDMPELPKMAKEKASKPMYAAVIRLVVQGTTKERSKDILFNLANSIIVTTRSPYNNLTPLSNGGYPFEKHLESVYERTSYRLGMLLNSEELVNLVHMPSPSVVSSKLSRQVVKSKPIPQDLSDGYYAIGTNGYLGEESTVWLNDEHRLRHTHIIGATGVGKSTFIANLFLQDCDAGNGCIVFDSHGDLVDDIVPRIQKEDLDRVILIDPSDTEYPIGFNLLEANTEMEKIILSSDLVETFKRNSIAWGDTMGAVLTNAINAFLEANQGGTLLELRKFLLDVKYRNSVLSNIEDLSVRSYWQYEFPQLKKGALAPLLTRIDTFLRPKIVRNMMAQNKGIDFKEALADNKIILVKLSQGLIGEENSYLLGTLILSKLYQAAQARQSISKAERSPYYVYIDEFHNFLTPSLSAILSGARKYGLGLVLAHQELAQIQDTTIGNSVLSNPSVRICFRVGDNDAQKLEKGFSYFDNNDLQNLSTGEAICRVNRNDWDFQMYTDDLPSADYYEDNIEIVRANTRIKYTTPVEEIEKLVNELYLFEPPQQKTKEPKQERVILKPIAEPKEEVPESLHIKPKPALDIETASKKFLETAEKQREQREHLYMQDFVKKMAEQRGFKAELEAPTTNGGRIDILLIRNELSIACELSVTNTIDYEVKNILKCIEVGYEHIVMLCSNETHLRNIKHAASEVLDISRVQFLNPEHLHLYLDTFAPKDNVKETRTRGYRIKTTYNVENEDPITDEAVKSTLREFLKRKN